MTNIFKTLVSLISSVKKNDIDDQCHDNKLDDESKPTPVIHSHGNIIFNNLIDRLEEEVRENGNHQHTKLSDCQSSLAIKALDSDKAIDLLIYCIGLFVKLQSQKSTVLQESYCRHIALKLTITAILAKKHPYEQRHITSMLEPLLNAERLFTYIYPIAAILRAVENFAHLHKINDANRALLEALADKIEHGRYAYADDKRLAEHARLVAHHTGALDFVIRPGEAWSDQALEDLKQMPDAMQKTWCALLIHCKKATSSKPTKKWLNVSEEFRRKIGHDTFLSICSVWFESLDKPKTKLLTRQNDWDIDPNLLFNDSNLSVLKGLVWCCSTIENDAVAKLLTHIGILSFTKIPGYGAKAARLGNAVIYALSAMPGKSALHMLCILKMKTKYRQALALLDKALLTAAQREGISVDECEEIGVPGFGLEKMGFGEERFGDFTAIVQIQGFHNVTLTWRKADGKIQKSIPVNIKEKYGPELKDLKANIKDIKLMLSAQKERLEQLFLKQLTWTFEHWKTCYLQHPLVGVIAQNLIWKMVIDNANVLVLYRDGRFEDVSGNSVENISNDTKVSLWHPIDSTIEQIALWRRRLENVALTQPFKQAHREVYLLTDAEKATNTYSNRFASHIIKQFQFSALAAARSWQYTLQGSWDGGFEDLARIRLEKYNLVAEFWVIAISEDTSDAGIFMYMSTDQVRFYEIRPERDRLNENNISDDRVVPLEQIPSLVLSEIFRDVDLFIGVSSIGNDPQWHDGGPDGRHQNYWYNMSFGELSVSANTRKEILERLVPKLQFGDKCSFIDRFLVVEGKRRIYKIHLGSGNILMEPNNQYLCIVPDSKKRSSETKVYLPFEGDRTLSIIISKAQLLANDDKIKDATINSQINNK